MVSSADLVTLVTSYFNSSSLSSLLRPLLFLHLCYPSPSSCLPSCLALLCRKFALCLRGGFPVWSLPSLPLPGDAFCPACVANPTPLLVSSLYQAYFFCLALGIKIWESWPGLSCCFLNTQSFECNGNSWNGKQSCLPFPRGLDSAAALASATLGC